MEPVVEFISTGSELMSGTTLDTNFSRAAERLALNGVISSYHVSVGDDPDAIIEVFGNALERSDVIIVSGGLGPTGDDLTADSASRFFGAELEFNQSEFNNIEKILNSMGRKVLSNHRKLAFFPKGARIIANNVGVAPGFSFNYKDRNFYFLPGVPSEFDTMLSEFVIPDILSKYEIRDSYSFRVLKTIGLGESEVSSRLSDIDFKDTTVSYRIYYPEVHVRLIARGNSKSEADEMTLSAANIIKERLGDLVFTDLDLTIEEVVASLLFEKNFTISTAESCTGGLLASRLTDIPGSSDYFKRGVVTYSNESKMDTLGVSGKLLEVYGAVSSQVVESMASGVRTISGTDIGVGISGIAGPSGGTAEKPVGTVFIGIDSDRSGVFSEKFLFHGTRKQIKLITTSYALNIIRNIILNIV